MTPPPEIAPDCYRAYLDQTARYGRCFGTLEDVVRYALQVVRPHQIDEFIRYLERLERDDTGEEELKRRWNPVIASRYHVVPGIKPILALALKIARREGPDGSVYLRCPVPKGEPWTTFPFDF